MRSNIMADLLFIENTSVASVARYINATCFKFVIAFLILGVIIELFSDCDFRGLIKRTFLALFVFATFEMFLVFNCKSNKSVFKSPINKYLIYAVLISIGLHLLAMYTSMNSLFYFVSVLLSLHNSIAHYFQDNIYTTFQIYISIRTCS